MSSEKKERIVDRFNREIEEVIGTICDDLCRYAREGLTQEELDAICENCVLTRL